MQTQQPKPICLVRFRAKQKEGSPTAAKLNMILSEKMPDYHVFVVPPRNYSDEEIEFEVFYDKDFTQLQYQELKDIVEESFKPKSNAPIGE